MYNIRVSLQFVISSQFQVSFKSVSSQFQVKPLKNKAMKTKTMEYKVVTEGSPNEVWAIGFYGDYGKAKAQKSIDEGYFHKYMYESDKSKKLIVVEA